MCYSIVDRMNALQCLFPFVDHIITFVMLSAVQCLIIQIPFNWTIVVPLIHRRYSIHAALLAATDE